MKRLIFVTQSKGGAGKSVLTFLLAEKYKDAVILDMDDATKTTTLQLKYRNPKQITFLNSANVIDRGYFNAFLEKVTASTNNLFICDLGASISEQLPYYLVDVNDFLPTALSELEVQIEFYVVVGGANIFSQTMTYLDFLNEAIKGQFTLKLLKNEYYEFAEVQNEELIRYATEKNLEIISFNISKDKNESTQNRIKEVLKSGEGIENAKTFSKMYFQNAISSLSV